MFVGLMRTAKRIFSVGFVTGLFLLFVLLAFVCSIGRRDKYLARVGLALCWASRTLGGGILKIGQVLSTRFDVFDARLLAPLQRLQDQASEASGEAIAEILERSLGCSMAEVFASFDARPVGCGTIAQVHRATLREGGNEVAVKVLKPGARETIEIDAGLFAAIGRLLGRLKAFRSVPITEIMGQLTATAKDQVSFALELDRHKEFMALFPGPRPVRIPRPFERYCSDRVLITEYVAGLTKVTDNSLDEDVHREAVASGLTALYRMIFVAGLIHCDLHPGNITVARDGGVVLIDFGWCSKMSSAERSAFAEFFLSIALGDGTAASRIVLEMAAHVPNDLHREAFEIEVCDLVQRCSGACAGDFLIARFVNTLFGIQKRFGVVGSPSFAMAIWSLVVYEGIIRQRCPDMDFQRHAVPSLLSSLS